MEDPGFVPKAGGRNGQKGIIDELLELRKFDEANFCVTCMVRRPLRSKHCKKCNRCVAKQDQYVQCFCLRHSKKLISKQSLPMGRQLCGHKQPPPFLLLRRLPRNRNHTLGLALSLLPRRNTAPINNDILQYSFSRSLCHAEF